MSGETLHQIGKITAFLFFMRKSTFNIVLVLPMHAYSIGLMLVVLEVGRSIGERYLKERTE